MPNSEEIAFTTPEKFYNAVLPYLPDYKSIDLRIIARRFGGKKNWTFNVVRALLDDGPITKPTETSLPTVEDLLLIHRRLKIEELKDLLRSLSEGQLMVGDDVIEVRNVNSGVEQALNPTFFFYDRNTCNSAFGVDYASFTLTWSGIISGAQAELEPRLIDSKLRTAGYPWIDLNDLHVNFIGMKTLYSTFDQGMYQVIAPIRTRFSSKSEISGRIVRASFEVPSTIDVSSLFISEIGYNAEGSVFRQRYHLVDLPSLTLDSEGAGHVELVGPSEFSRAKLILSLRGREADILDLYGKIDPKKNPRLGVLQELGIDSDTLGDLLRGKDAKRFEKGVALLFYCLGFSTAPTGLLDSDAPDIVASYDANATILVVECTLREIDQNNKISKLVARARIPVQAKVIPLIVTAYGRSQVGESNLEKATKEGIPVLTSDEIPSLFTMMLEGRTVLETVNYLETLRTAPFSSAAYPPFG